MTVPRWLELQFNIDHALWVLEGMIAEERNRSALDRMIDEACGADARRLADADALIADVRAWRDEYDALVGDVPTD